jgi:uncharacterized Ntn-hydrolase superfamily protein
MTWSILARDNQGPTRFGAAIASRFFAVGALCVHAQRGVGVVATQALMNPLYGPAGLALLAAGRTPAQVVAELTAADGGRSQRQLHVLANPLVATSAGDHAGAVAAAAVGAAHTGLDCVDWCGHQQHASEGFSVAGNMLAGPQVLQATADAYRASAGQPLAERLILAMQAGEAAGGDKRGKQSAALLIQGDEDRAELDLRVDDHLDPLTELQRLYEVSLLRYQPFIACLAGRHNAVGETDRARIEARIAVFHAERQRIA